MLARAARTYEFAPGFGKFVTIHCRATNGRPYKCNPIQYDKL